MAVLTFPNIVPGSISFGIKYNTQINISSLSGAVQTIEIPGARWVSNLSFSDMEPNETRVLAAFLTELRGASGRFYLYDFSHKNPRGSNLASGNIIIDVDATISSPIISGTTTAGSTSTTLVDSGGNFVNTGISAGDYIKNVTKSELKRILSFSSDTITIESTWVVPGISDSYEVYPNTGNSITTSGWDPSETDVLLPGDYIEIEGSELKIVTSSVSSDANGEAIINFDPPIRTSPSNLSSVVRTNCKATMLLDTDESRWDTNNAGLLSTINISCMEGF